MRKRGRGKRNLFTASSMRRRAVLLKYRALLAKASENSSQMEAPTTSAQLYCLCRSFDRSQFMIACHHCGVQYHGRCVGVAEQAATFILQYACPPCRDKDATLNVIYKMPNTDQCLQPLDDEETVEMQESTDGEDNRSLMEPFTVGWFHNYANFLEWTTEDQKESGVEAISEESAEEIGIAEDVEKILPFRSKSNVTSDKQREDEQDSVIVVSEDTSETKPKKKRRKQSCKKCSACAITEDCGVCLLCKDMPKFGGSGNLRQKCVKRRCLFMKPSRHVPYVGKRVSKKKKKKKKKKRLKKCFKCKACRRKLDCGECRYCLDKTKFGGHNIIRQKCVLRRCTKHTPTYNSYCKTISRESLRKTEIIQSIDALNCKDSGPKQRGTKPEQSSIDPKQSGIDSKQSGIDPKQSGINPKQSGIDPKESGRVVRKTIKEKLKALKVGCHQCEPSQRPDCRKCVYCLDQKKYGGKGLWRAKCKIRRCSPTCPTVRLRKELKKQLMEAVEMMKKTCQRHSCENFPIGRSRYCSKTCEVRAATRNAFVFLPRKIKLLRANCKDKQILAELELLQAESNAVQYRIGAMGKRIKELRNIVGRARQATRKAKRQATRKAKKNVQGEDQENPMDCPGSATVVRESELACFMNKRRKNAESINVVGQTWGAEKIMKKKKADMACCCPLVPHLFDRTYNYCLVPQCECREHQGWEILLKTEVELERVREWLQVHRIMEKLQDLEMMTS